MTPRLAFLGACGTVTGSRFLLRQDGAGLLVDCGVFQGSREMEQKNWDAPGFRPREVSAIAITHAHIDHTGYVPRFARDGWEGPVWVTPPTADLLDYLWPDAGRLHEEDARFANKKGYSRHRPALPLFTEEEARKALGLCRSLPFRERLELAPNLAISFRRAGHILGASFLVVESSGVRIAFSGDLGQNGVPILKDPEPLERVEYLILESTYGDRLHPKSSPEEELAAIVQQTVSRAGVLLIPAFAVGRTQDILYFLRRLQLARRIPEDLPIFVDSPMATSVVETYCSHTAEHDLEMSTLRDQGRCPIQGPSVRFTRTSEESKRLNDRRGPMVVVSASGMLSGGRVLHHLKRRLPDSTATLLFVGFQAEGTLGRRILSGDREVRVHGELVGVRAEVRSIPALSAHADQKGLLQWIAGLREPPRAVFLVHGEEGPRRALAEAIRARFGWNVALPAEGEDVELSRARRRARVRKLQRSAPGPARRSSRSPAGTSSARPSEASRRTADRTSPHRWPSPRSWRPCRCSRPSRCLPPPSSARTSTRSSRS
jgi:metallo-beta-lactamase family protein